MRSRPELQPLQYRALEQAGRLEGLSPEARRASRGAYFGTLSRNLHTLERLQVLLDAAETADIPVLPIKGLVLGELLYGDVGLRPMVDVDLLVHPADLDRLLDRYAELGLRRAFPDTPRFARGYAHDVALIDPGGVLVEVHHRLFHELGGDASVQALFSRAQRLPLGGRLRTVPAWDDHLFLVGVHAATHALAGSPLWLTDLGLLSLRCGGVENALAEARRRGLGLPFLAAAHRARDYLPALISTMTPLPRLRGWALRSLSQALPGGESGERVRSLLVRALLTEDPREAARALARKARLSWGERDRWRRRA